MSSEERQGWLFNAAAAVVLVGLLAVMGLLIKQNRELKAELAERHASTMAVPALEVGEQVEGFILPALDGSMTRVDFSAPRSDTVLFFFSPECPACDENFANWVAIEDLGRHPDRRLVFLSSVSEEETRKYVAGFGLESEVLIADREMLQSYKVSHIPMTVLVRSGGQVGGVWLGILPDKVVNQL